MSSARRRVIRPSRPQSCSQGPLTPRRRSMPWRREPRRVGLMTAEAVSRPPMRVVSALEAVRRPPVKVVSMITEAVRLVPWQEPRSTGSAMVNSISSQHRDKGRDLGVRSTRNLTPISPTSHLLTTREVAGGATVGASQMIMITSPARGG